MDTSLLTTNIDENMHITEHIEYKTIVNQYKEAIDIIDEIRENQNWNVISRLVTHLAKNSPNVLVDSYKSVTSDPYNLDKELMVLMSRNKKIAAIKLCREKTDLSLKESKEYCDELWRKHAYNNS